VVTFAAALRARVHRDSAKGIFLRREDEIYFTGTEGVKKPLKKK
jgi:hypothetical protein